MLPRHVRRLRLDARSLAHPPLTAPRTRLAPISQFHSSSRRADELPKSPFQTFVDVLKDELRKNRELNDNVRQLQGDVDKLQDSEALKRAKDMYERARVCVFPNSLFPRLKAYAYVQLTSSIKENPRLRAAAEELRKGGVKVSDAVSEAIKSMEESDWMRSVRISRLKALHIKLIIYIDLQSFCGRVRAHRECHRAYPEHGSL
jgi:mitochondrial import inner membrane translocase subunit TIM44